jgi:hypothetical protein
MTSPALPTVFVSETAKRKILAEVERWAREGLSREGTPYEAIAYPLSALMPRGQRLPALSPLETLSVRDFGALVIADAAIPPDEVKNFTAYNCHFQAPDLDLFQRLFNAQIDEIVRQHPALGVFSKLHSHPFSGGDFLSGGDLAKNVYHPNAVLWRERLGLEEAILHVVYPRRSVREIVGTGAASGPRTEFSQETHLEEQEAKRYNRATEQGVSVHASDKGPWGLATFAVHGSGQMVRLPGPVYVPDDDPRVLAARAQPYWMTPRGKAWDDKQKAALAEAGFKPSRGLLGRGWRRYIVSPGGERDLVFCLPPDFPKRLPRVLAIVDAARNLFQKMPLPKQIQKAKHLSEVDLVRLAKQYAPKRKARRSKS